MALADKTTIDEVKVWDAFVRVFHWTLVTAFLVAYFTGDEVQAVHVWAGYLVIVFVTLRILWGFVGSSHARFSSFVYRPQKVLHYMRQLLQLRGRRYLGHSPAGGAMVLLLLVLLLLVTGTGLVAFASLDGSGPLAGIIPVRQATGRFWKEIHEFLAEVTLGAVIVHICGVLWASLAHHENLIRAMWTGRKESRTHHH